MTIKTCDKCGAKINTNPILNMVLPALSISRLEDFVLGWQPVDLCPKCEKMLAEWLNDKSDTLDDDASVQRWTPIDEGTPTKPGRYFVTVSRLTGDKVATSNFDNGEFWDGGVLAWMPLPKPYRPEGEDHGKEVLK